MFLYLKLFIHHPHKQHHTREYTAKALKDGQQLSMVPLHIGVWGYCSGAWVSPEVAYSLVLCLTTEVTANMVV